MMIFKKLTEKETSDHLMKYTSFCVNVDMINQMSYDLLQDKYKEYLSQFNSTFLFIFKRTPVTFESFVSGASPNFLSIVFDNNKPYMVHSTTAYHKSTFKPELSQKERNLIMLASRYERVRFKFDKYIKRVRQYASYPYQLEESDIKTFEFFDDTNEEIVKFVKNYTTP